jgi:hypothetical protein
MFLNRYFLSSLVFLFTIHFNLLTAGAWANGVICAVGDAGSGNENQMAVGQAMARFGCTEILFLGDNFYPNGVESVTDPMWQSHFETPYRSLIQAGAIFRASLGNHDHKGNTAAQVEYGHTHPHWYMPQPYYFRELGSGICIFSIDSDVFDEAQGRWLSSELARRPCPYKIVMGHHPVVSSGRHGNGDDHIQHHLRPVLAGADVYIAGHDHHYSDEGVVTATAQSRTSTGSFRQLVVGTGGARLKPTICRTRDCRRVVNEYGFLHLHITSDEFGTENLEWTFVDSNLRARHTGKL